jgi:hypothetical protein
MPPIGTDYDRDDDFRRSIEFAYEHIRECVALGGKGWRGFPMSEWQSIETAPKDSRIRVWAGGYEHHARWNDDQYAKKPRPYWDVEGWRTTQSRARQPTHWMLTSEPPK